MSKPRSFVQKKISPAVPIPKTDNRMDAQWMQNVRERLDGLETTTIATTRNVDRVSTTVQQVIDVIQKPVDPESETENTVGALVYRGMWNASTGASIPAGVKGDYYVVSADGVTSIGGITPWRAGDWAVFNGTAWTKVDNTTIGGAPFYVPEDELFYIPDNHQALYKDDLIVDGVLVTNGLLKELVTQATDELPIVTVTGNTTLTASHFTVLCNAASGAITITLPPVADYPKQTYQIKKIDTTGNTVTIDGNSGDTIDGATTVVIGTPYESYTIRSNESAWYVV